MKNGKTLAVENEKLNEKLKTLQNEMVLQIQHNENVNLLKNQIKEIVESKDATEEELEKTKKELQKLRSEYKEVKLYADAMDSEVKVIKQQ